MFHIEKAHYIVDEMVANGAIVENRCVMDVVFSSRVDKFVTSQLSN